MFKAVFKSNLKRYWWIPALCMFVLALFVIYPAKDNLYLNFPYQSVTVIAVIFGAANSLAVFSYMHSQRAINLFHSLPSTRNGIFAANTVFAAVSTLLPGLITAAIVPALTEKGSDGQFGTILLYWCLAAMITLALGCFVSMFTGSFAAAIIFTPIMFLLPFFLESMLSALAGEYLYGHDGSMDGLFTRFLSHKPFDSPSAIIFSVILIAVLLAGAYLAYIKRPMEAAGEIVFYGWTKTLFTQGAAICFGMLISVIIDGGLKLPLILIFGLIFAAAAMMIVQKTYRIRGFVKQAAAFVCIVLAVFAAFRFDVFGYARRTPKVANVSAVYVRMDYYGSIRLTDTDAIAEIIDAHKTIVKQRPQGTLDFELDYALKNGSTLHRSYEIDSKSGILDKLLSTEAFKTACFGLDQDWRSISLYKTGSGEDYANNNVEGLRNTADIEALRSAIAADLKPENFSTDFVMSAITNLKFAYDYTGPDYIYVEYRVNKSRDTYTKDLITTESSEYSYSRGIYISSNMKNAYACALNLLERYKDVPDEANTQNEPAAIVAY